MAVAQRSRSCLLVVAAMAALVATALWSAAPAFVPGQAALRGGQPAAAAVAGAAAAALPAASLAMPEVGAVDAPAEMMEVGSSVSLAGLTEILMCGIVMGVVPTTILGLLVRMVLALVSIRTSLAARRANIPAGLRVQGLEVGG
mmetsp:Transcript_25900/g.77358  ORF Transcript_25900/g.77358 Transcript_25900/m.77358 type:complete len:144 (+) Transcript_25900:99-530(+)